MLQISILFLKGTVNVVRGEVNSPDMDPIIRSQRLKTGYSKPIPSTETLLERQNNYRGPFQPNTYVYPRLKPDQLSRGHHLNVSLLLFWVGPLSQNLSNPTKPLHLAASIGATEQPGKSFSSLHQIGPSRADQRFCPLLLLGPRSHFQNALDAFFYRSPSLH